MSSTSPSSPQKSTGNPGDLNEPPIHWLGILSHLGPGLIIAASIVGSGELIATTITGAKAGLSLLWLIILGCVIKVFAQIEIGRFTLSSGIPTLSALNQVPGPRIQGRGNWLIWYWFVMWFCSIGQLGAIVGGVGQTLAMVQPVTQQGRLFQEIATLESKRQLGKVIEQVEQKNLASGANQATIDSPSKEAEAPLPTEAQILAKRRSYIETYGTAKALNPSELASIDDKTLMDMRLLSPIDDRIWAIPIAIGTSLMLIYGGYNFIQSAATIMVAIFTLVTLGNVVGLQLLPAWQIPMSQWMDGLSFGLPKGDLWKSLAMAFATIGIIGVGAAELIQYPYWCLEKGYAKRTGKYDGSDAWVRRARGWLRIMQTDIWVSMVIYTVATIGFFVLGAGILHRAGIEPQDSKLLQTLSVMYKPVLGSWAQVTFLLGAFMVLYSTFYVANASHARTFADALSIMSVIGADEPTQTRWVRWLSGLFPMLCLLIYWVMPQPAWLVLLSGSAQAIMLPMLGFSALFFRYRRCLPELRPSKWFDIGLWGSIAILFVIGIATLILEANKFFR
jgi:Mn2+/Fe2+ NRAMP family transporter